MGEKRCFANSASLRSAFGLGFAVVVGLLPAFLVIELHALVTGEVGIVLLVVAASTNIQSVPLTTKACDGVA